MQLNRSLTINAIKRRLVDERVFLDLSSPGRAQFTVVSDADADADAVKVNQLVTFDLGYSNQTSLQRWFIGVTEKVVPMSDKRIKIFCRELSSSLSYPLPLSLRHVTLRDVTAAIHELTGLNFAVPDVAYADTKVANFYNGGSGYLAMASIGRVFNIPDYIWQQQSGVVYVGSWADSRWAGIKNMDLPDTLFDGHDANEMAKIGAIPQLRPGIRINGNRLTTIQFEKNHMTVGWGK